MKRIDAYLFIFLILVSVFSNRSTAQLNQFAAGAYAQSLIVNESTLEVAEDRQSAKLRNKAGQLSKSIKLFLSDQRLQWR